MFDNDLILIIGHFLHMVFVLHRIRKFIFSSHSYSDWITSDPMLERMLNATSISNQHLKICIMSTSFIPILEVEARQKITPSIVRFIYFSKIFSTKHDLAGCLLLSYSYLVKRDKVA